ncbi:MAG: hypothetical protein WC641_08515 [Patescibacteria group bacterium]
MKNFFEAILGGKTEKQEKIHPDFNLREGGWFFNNIHAPWNQQYLGAAVDAFDKRRIKTRFAFNDPKLLDGCAFHAKVGLNADESLPYKYIGFAYETTHHRKELEDWSRRFPYAEILVGLDKEWVQNINSERIPLSGEEKSK